MNTQRLLTLAKELQKEIAGTKVIAMLTGLAAEFEAAVNTLNEATQRAVEKRVGEIATRLAIAPSNDLSPGFKVELEELKIRDAVSARELVGSALAERVQATVENGYTVKSLDG